MSTPSFSSATITLRPAAPEDSPDLHRVAQLDSAPLPSGRLLLAQVDRRILAAISIDTGAVIADPFARTTELVAMLRDRAALLQPAAAANSARRPLLRLRSTRRPTAI